MFIQSCCRTLIKFAALVGLVWTPCQPLLATPAASPPSKQMVVRKGFYQPKAKQFNERTLPLEHQPQNFTIQQAQRQDDYCQLVLLNLGWLLCGDVQVRLRGAAVELLSPTKRASHQVWGSFEKES